MLLVSGTEEYVGARHAYVIMYRAYVTMCRAYVTIASGRCDPMKTGTVRARDTAGRICLVIS